MPGGGASTLSQPSCGYPRIVIEGEQHSSGPDIDKSIHSDDAIKKPAQIPTRGFSLPLDKELYLHKLRHFNFRGLGGRRTNRPIRKLRRQERVCGNILPF